MTLEKLIFLLLRDDREVLKFIEHVYKDKKDGTSGLVEFDARWKSFLYLLDDTTSDDNVSKESIIKFVNTLNEIKQFFNDLIKERAPTPAPTPSSTSGPVPSSTSGVAPSSTYTAPLPPDGDYTQIYMFYNNDNNKLKMHVYNKDNDSKTFYESFKDISEDVDEQLSSVSDYIYNKTPDDKYKFYKVDISGEPDKIQYDKSGPFNEEYIKNHIN